MGNKQRGEVTIDINGTAYTLVLDLNALAVFEQQLCFDLRRDVTWEQGLALVERRQLLAARAVMWAALQRHHPATTVVQAGDLMEQLGGMAKIEQALRDAVAQAMPTKEDREASGNPRGARKNGRGAASSSEPGPQGLAATSSGR